MLGTSPISNPDCAAIVVVGHLTAVAGTETQDVALGVGARVALEVVVRSTAGTRSVLPRVAHPVAACGARRVGGARAPTARVLA